MYIHRESENVDLLLAFEEKGEDFKILQITFKARSGLALSYITDILISVWA